MKKISFYFDRKWVTDNREEYGNPIRVLEKHFKTRDIKLVKSDFNSITVELEDDCQDDVSHIIGFIKAKFGIENPWKDVLISGEITSVEHFINERKKDGKVETVSVEEDEFTFVQKKELKVEEPKTEESKVEEQKTEEPIIEEVNTEVHKKTESISSVLRYSPAMEKYLQELNQIIPMMQKMQMENCIWEQNLFVSIDEGFGYKEFLEEIACTFGKYGLAEKKEDWIKEFVIKQGATSERAYEEWEQVLNYAKTCAKYNDKEKTKIILSLDISEWQGQLQSGPVRRYLQQIAECTRNIICVFRVPYVEFSVLQRMCEVLFDFMAIKCLLIPPISIENMVDFMKERMTSMGGTFEEGCETFLEQMIMREKTDDSFWGYKTLEKIIGEIIYQKALLNCESGNNSKNVSISDLERMIETDASIDDAYTFLNKLIGLADVKQQIQEIVTQIKCHKNLANQGIEVDRPCIHMMFTGNPGTGKTTVARLLARILKDEGVLRKGHFFEVHGRSLCGRYVGETAPRTSAICRDAYGSVLFIDEAYSLLRKGSDNDYGKEAVQTLIAEMENHRDDFCVILAGYKKPMEELMEVNHGLKSRIPYEIVFPNYTREELVQIFNSMLENKFEYEENLKSVVEEFFANIPDEVLSSEEFSNARLVRNLFERVWGKTAYRCSMSGEKLVIKKEDFLCAAGMVEFKEMMKEKRRNIGFSF